MNCSSAEDEGKEKTEEEEELLEEYKLTNMKAQKFLKKRERNTSLNTLNKSPTGTRIFTIGAGW